MKSYQSLLIIFSVSFSLSWNLLFSQNVRIDHVILLYKDIDKAINEFQKNGFTVKQGRLHENGLINAHIKFANTSSVELISIKHKANDEISRTYEKLLKQGEGGVYVALTGIPFTKLEKELLSLNIPFNKVNGKAWDYITFQDSSGLEHFFFIEYHIEFKVTSNLFNHENQSNRIKSVWIECDKYILDFMEDLGVKYKKVDDTYTIDTSTGEIIIIRVDKKIRDFAIRAISFVNEKGEITKFLEF